LFLICVLCVLVIGRKVVVVTHSMGSNVWYYFMKWVEDERGGRGGPNWVNDNIEGALSPLSFSLSLSLLLSLWCDSIRWHWLSIFGGSEGIFASFRLSLSSSLSIFFTFSF
jgi:hypothetical protein